MLLLPLFLVKSPQLPLLLPHLVHHQLPLKITNTHSLPPSHQAPVLQTIHPHHLNLEQHLPGKRNPLFSVSSRVYLGTRRRKRRRRGKNEALVPKAFDVSILRILRTIFFYIRCLTYLSYLPTEQHAIFLDVDTMPLVLLYSSGLCLIFGYRTQQSLISVIVCIFYLT